MKYMIVMNRKRVLVVGGGVQHSYAIQILKGYGHYVILADYTQNPIGKQYVDKHIQVNAFDAVVLERIAIEEKIDLIINICFDLAMPAVAFVSEKLGLSAPFSYEQSLNNTDKMRMKGIFIKNKIPTANYCVVDNCLSFPDSLSFPIVVKPTDSSGSRGISKVNSVEDCNKAIQFALSQSKQCKVIIEEFIVGKEYQIDCIVDQGITKIVLAKQKLRFSEEDVVSPAGSFVLPDDQNTLLGEENELANKLAEAFGIKSGAFFFQCIEKEGILYVIEVGVRVGGGLGYKMIRDIKGVDLVKIEVDSWLGKRLEYSIKTNNDFYLSNAIFSTRQCSVKCVKGLEELCQSHIVDCYDAYTNNEKSVDGQITNKNRLALYLTHASSLEKLKTNFQKIINNVVIVEDGGEKSFDNELYQSLLGKF